MYRIPRRTSLVGFLAITLISSAAAQPHRNSDQKSNADSASSAAAASSSPQSATENSADYVIGDDDVLGIDVWNEKELTQSLPVRSDGRISMPLVGEVQAAGLTPMQLQTSITEKLKAFLTNPQVTVIVRQMNSRKFNVLGRVLKPGSYPLTATTTVLDALALAGGFQDFAKQKNIYILRNEPDGRQKRIPFNYKSVIRGNHPAENILLKPHDTIVVP